MLNLPSNYCDWNSIHNLPDKSYEEQVVAAINAGIDMLMEPSDFDTAKQIIVDSVNKAIAEKVEKDKAIKEKAINDLKTKIEAESQEKADRKNAIMADMKELDTMKANM